MSNSGSGFLCCVCADSPPSQRKAQSKENLVLDHKSRKQPPNSGKHQAGPGSGGAHSNPAYQDSRKSNGVHNANGGRVVNSRSTSSSAAAVPGDLDLDPVMAANLEKLVQRLEVVTSRLESVSSGGGGGDGSEELAAFVQAFDEILNGSFAQFMQASGTIGGDVKTQADLVKAAFQAERSLLITASKSREPPQDKLVAILKPMSEKIQASQNYREQNRGSKFFNHLSAISESVPALGWVTVSPTPAPFVKEMSDAGQFYTNRVLKEYKEKDKTHAEWVKAWLSTLNELQTFIKQFHTTGLSWNKQGGEASAVPSGGAPAASGGPPAPPPPGPPPSVADLLKQPGKDDSTAARGALFADISKGEGVTSGLRKVTDDMKTHKNPSLKLQTPVPYKAKPSPSPKPVRATTQAPSKPPKCALEGKKWIVEYHDGNRNLVISDTNIKQTVYIYRCQNSTVQVKGKVNSITLDGCKKVGLVFDDCISVIDVVNSQSVQIQVMSKVPTVSIDKTDGCMVYLSKDSLSTEFVSAKSSEMNILIPQADGEYKECAVPEQYKTKWNGKTLVTEATDIAS